MVSSDTRCLGHPGAVGLKKPAALAEAGLEGVDGAHHDLTYGVCMLAKQTREPFKRSTSQTTEMMELLHTDLMGPFQVPSWGGVVYVVTLMDDYSGVADLTCIVRKYDVSEWMRDTIGSWGRQTGMPSRRSQSASITARSSKAGWMMLSTRRASHTRGALNTLQSRTAKRSIDPIKMLSSRSTAQLYSALLWVI